MRHSFYPGEISMKIWYKNPQCLRNTSYFHRSGPFVYLTDRYKHLLKVVLVGKVSLSGTFFGNLPLQTDPFSSIIHQMSMETNIYFQKNSLWLLLFLDCQRLFVEYACILQFKIPLGLAKQQRAIC